MKSRRILAGGAVVAVLATVLGIGAADPMTTEAAALAQPTAVATSPATAVATAPATNTPVPTNTPVLPTNTPTQTPTALPTNTAAPASPTPTSALPADTPGPTFTPVPTAAATATILPASVPTVAATALSTPPPSTTPVDAGTGGRIVGIPTAAPGQDAVAILTPAPDRAAIDPVIIVPAPAAGETPVAVRFQPVDAQTFTERLPSGVTASKVIDFSVIDPTTGRVQTVFDRPIQFVFPISDADMAAVGNDPSKYAVFRIDRDTGNLVRVDCDVDFPHRVARCQTYHASFFVSGQLTSTSAATYRYFLSGVSRNDRAIAGSTLARDSVSAFTMFNTSATVAASVSVTFYKADGTTGLLAPLVVSVPAAQSLLVYVPNVAGLADGTYSVVLDSTQVIAVVVNTATDGGVSRTGAVGESANGATDTAALRQFFLPEALRSYFGWQTLVVVQNADLTGPNTVTLTVRDRTGASAYTANQTIPAGAAATFDLSTSTLPLGFSGTATLTSTLNSIATYHVYNATGGLASGNALANGSVVSYLPSLYNNYHGYVSSLSIQNLDAANADYRVVVDGQTLTGTIAGNGSTVLYLPNLGLPDGFIGPATVSSTNGKRLAVVGNTANPALGRFDIVPASATGGNPVVAPAVYKNYASGRWSSAIVVQNIGSTTTTVSATFDDGTTASFGAIGAGQSGLLYLPNLSALGDGYRGGARISTSDGSPLVVQVNTDQISASTLTGADYLITYVSTSG